jgi:hypothetical protein
MPTTPSRWTARQPTTKTLFLLMTVNAMLFALCPKKMWTYHESPAVANWVCYSSQVLFWSIPPLLVGMYCRSVMIAAAWCIGLGLLGDGMLIAYNSGVSHRIVTIVCGIFGCCMGLNSHLGFHSHILLLIEFLVFYPATAFLIAMTCRLREQPERQA